MEDMIRPNSEFIWKIKKYPIKVVAIPMRANPLSLAEGRPETAAIKNLKKVIEIQ